MNKINENLLYVVYAVKGEAGEEPFYMYCFFKRLDSASEGLGEGKEQWWIVDQVFFSAKSLSYADFEQIKTGSSFSEVVAIDPMTEVYRLSDASYLPPVLTYKSYHYLTDGILCITFSRENADGEYIVSEIGYNPDFEVADAFGAGLLTLKIDPEDYPD